jgi:hypothetical protein
MSNDMDYEIEKVITAVTSPPSVEAGTLHPLCDGGSPLYGHDGKFSVTTHASTRAVIAEFEPAAGDGPRVVIYELTAEGTLNTSVGVRALRVGPELHHLYSKVGFVGGFLAMTNVSAADDRSGSISGGLLHDVDDRRIAKLSTSDLDDLSSSKAVLGYGGRDGVVVMCPSPHMGQEMKAVRTPHTTNATQATNIANLEADNLIVFSYNSLASGVDGPWLSTLGITASTVAIFDTVALPSGNLQDFSTPNNVYTVDLSMRFTVNVVGAAISTLDIRARFFDDAGVEIPIKGLNGDNVNIFESDVSIAVSTPTEIVTPVVTVSSSRPIASVRFSAVGLGGGGRTVDLYNRFCEIKYHKTPMRLQSRHAIAMATGLTGGDSISLRAGYSVAARLNNTQSRLYSAKEFSGDAQSVSGAMSTVIRHLIAHPVATGDTYPRIAGAISEATMTLEDSLENPQAFGFGGLKKFARTMGKVIKTGAHIGEMMGIPGAKLVGEGIDTLSSGLERVRSLHRDLRDPNSVEGKRLANLKDRMKIMANVDV